MPDPTLFVVNNPELDEIHQMLNKLAGEGNAAPVLAKSQNRIVHKTEANTLDIVISILYCVLMKKISKPYNFYIFRKTLAREYGVDIAEVTDDFLEEVIASEESKANDYFRSFEEKRGKKLEKDTPEHREEIEKEVNKIKLKSLTNSLH